MLDRALPKVLAAPLVGQPEIEQGFVVNIFRPNNFHCFWIVCYDLGPNGSTDGSQQTIKKQLQ